MNNFELLPIKENTQTVDKVWGQESWIVNNQDYCLKFLKFNKGAQLSTHFHIEKKETWLVVRGKFNFTYFDYQKGIEFDEVIQVGDIITINRHVLHGLEALEDSEILEVSTTHKDEDSYRISFSKPAKE